MTMTNPQIPAFEPQPFELPATGPPPFFNNPPLSAPSGPSLLPTVASFDNLEPEEEDLSEFNEDQFEVRHTGQPHPPNNEAMLIAAWSQLLTITAPPQPSFNSSTRPPSQHNECLLFNPIQVSI